jgi:GntP family gluconate:H+ symporter
VTATLVNYLAPLMFAALLAFLLTGFPVAFGLAAVGIVFGLIAIEAGLAPAALFNALPLRLYGIMANDVLLAIPFFTFMGLILERSRMAEDLLETIGQVFGPMRAGLAIAVIVVGAMLAATTGVVAAAVISMGLISLPIMMRYGYNQPLAGGVIMASGTLAQIIPPSLVLIVIADQLGTSVGDMYRAAFIPAFALVGIYIVAMLVIAVVKPSWAPALPPEARAFREPSGASGYTSLTLLMAISAVVGVVMFRTWPQIKAALFAGTQGAMVDERIVIALSAAFLFAFLVAVIDQAVRSNLLSAMARRVTFVLIPPLLLVFLVLGTIFLGVATPTEGGAMGAAGALILALARRRLSFTLLKQALDASARLSIFVMFILIGSTIFALTFNAIDGHKWVKALFAELPGGQMGFLIFVSVMVFILGCFIDFFEIAFILLPLLAPVAKDLGVDMIFFGVLIGMVLQTSFLTPPFGFSLFYLRSVAAKEDYTDKVTGKRIPRMTTNALYRGAMAFVALQLVMVVLMLAYPRIVLMGLGEQKKLDTESVDIFITPESSPSAPATDLLGAPPAEAQPGKDDAVMDLLMAPKK